MAHEIKIEEVENGLKITDTLDGNIVIKYLTTYALPFIRSTNEAGLTFQVVDTVGEIYNLPAEPDEFILYDITGTMYLSSDGTELIENSLNLKPFRRENSIDRVVSIGAITATSNNVSIGLDISGVNSVMINGHLRSKSVPDTTNPFTPVTTGIKVLIVEAKDDPQIFYLVEGIEAPEAVEPEYDGLFVARLIVSSTGVIIEEEDTDYKLTSSDNWRQYTIGTNDSFTIDMGNSLAASFEIKVSGASAPTIGLVKQKAGKSFWDGSPFRFFNNSNKDIPFTTETYTDGLFKFLTFEPFVLKAGLWVEFVLKAGILVAEKTSNPIDLSPYALDADLDAEIVNRAMADALKLDKPLTPNNISTRVVNADNSTSDKGDFQQSAQIEISANTTALDSWKGKEIWVTASCTLTIPAPSTLSAEWNIDILVFPSVTLTLAITSPGTWLHTTPGTVTDAFFRIARRGNTTTFKTLGL